jgi:hypothetical protein
VSDPEARSAATPCGDERPHAPHVWHGIALLEVGTKYGDDWRCPGVSAAQGRYRDALFAYAREVLGDRALDGTP